MKSNALISQTWVVYPLLEVETGMKAILIKTIRALKEKKNKVEFINLPEKRTHVHQPRNSRYSSLRVD